MTTSTGTEPDRNRIDAVNEGSLSAALAARVKLRALDRLILPPHDASSHTPQSLQKLSSTVAAIGIEPPILITKQGVVVAGLGRVNAAKSLGLSEVACIDIEEMSEIERRGYIHAHQKLALASGWDESLLATESLTLPEAIAPDRPGQLIGGMTSADETVPLSSEGDTTTRAGDVWLFGQHRLSCGSAEALEPYRQVMGDLRAGLVFTHPLCSAAAHGEASPPFLTTVFTRLAAYTSDDAILFACSDWRHMKDVLDAGSATFGPPANVIVWLKDLDGKGEFCDSGHELIFAFQKQSASSSGSDQSRLSYGRDVWRHRGGPELHFNAFGEAMVLPTVRPVGLVSDAIAEFPSPGASCSMHSAARVLRSSLPREPAEERLPLRPTRPCAIGHCADGRIMPAVQFGCWKLEKPSKWLPSAGLDSCATNRLRPAGRQVTICGAALVPPVP